MKDNATFIVINCIMKCEVSEIDKMTVNTAAFKFGEHSIPSAFTVVLILLCMFLFCQHCHRAKAQLQLSNKYKV
jgi:hypothetical protein